MSEKRISITNGHDEKLVGLEATPLAERVKYPTIILVHGFNVTKEELGYFDGLTKSLSEAGFLVYRFDFSGCGESEGDYSQTSLSKLKSDLSKIVEFVKSQDKVDTSKIGMLGQSFGTATVVAFEPDVQCLVLTSCLPDPKEALSRMFGEGYNPSGVSVRAKPSGAVVKMGPQFWSDFANHDLSASIKRINCPILFLHGTEDDKVTVESMETYYQQANEPKEKMIIQGADHGFAPYREKVYGIIADWFKKYL